MSFLGHNVLPRVPLFMADPRRILGGQSRSLANLWSRSSDCPLVFNMTRTFFLSYFLSYFLSLSLSFFLSSFLSNMLTQSASFHGWTWADTRWTGQILGEPMIQIKWLPISFQHDQDFLTFLLSFLLSFFLSLSLSFSFFLSFFLPSFLPFFLSNVLPQSASFHGWT